MINFYHSVWHYFNPPRCYSGNTVLILRESYAYRFPQHLSHSFTHPIYNVNIIDPFYDLLEEYDLDPVAFKAYVAGNCAAALAAAHSLINIGGNIGGDIGAAGDNVVNQQPAAGNNIDVGGDINMNQQPTSTESDVYTGGAPFAQDEYVWTDSEGFHWRVPDRPVYTPGQRENEYLASLADWSINLITAIHPQVAPEGYPIPEVLAENRWNYYLDTPELHSPENNVVAHFIAATVNKTNSPSDEQFNQGFYYIILYGYTPSGGWPEGLNFAY